jgi:hypothetical protein
MLNLRIDFKNIKVAKEGFCRSRAGRIISYRCSLTQRRTTRKLAEIYLAYNLALTVADSLAPEISETINNIGEFIQKLKNDVK